MVRAHVVVSGLVQGVFFRQSAADEADRAGVAGWVRNLSDGRVEAVFEGAPAGVEALVAWCREGTPFSQVEDVEVAWEEPEGLTGFRIRH
jgi:acylphosphatase